MSRRSLTVTLLALLAVQLLGGLVFASVCPEPCPDDAPGATCPPICALCTSCTHAQQAIVQQTPVTAVELITAPHVFPSRDGAAPSQLAADIFHVPLLG